MSGSYQSSDLINGIENIQNGVVVASNTKIIWFEKNQNGTVNRICVHNLIDNMQYHQ